jgi:hypothetical protein
MAMENPMDTRSGDPDRFRIDLTGQRLLGTYLVRQKLGEGGMGTVYLAHDENLGRPVVVKVPHPRFFGEEGFRDRFMREIAELVRLEHPHIARILARGEHDGLPFFVLQYLGGGSLEGKLNSRGGRPMSSEEVLGFAEIVAETLDFVHGRGVVHRDVKPANILFSETGHVFLSDFGVAKALAADGGITGTGVMVGSPRYMAPEQGRGGDIGPAADQYALATMIYEALTGVPPFTGDTPIAILLRKVQEEPADLRELLPRIPRAASRAVMRALSREPSARFPSCEAFVATLREGFAEIETREAPALGRGQRRLPRALEWSGVAALVAVAVLALFLRHSDEPKSPGVTLLAAGREPRQVLRYRVAPGQVEQAAMTDIRKLSLKFGGGGPVPAFERDTEQNSSMASELSVVRLRPREGIEFLWKMTLLPGEGDDSGAEGSPSGAPFLDLLEDCPVRVRVDDCGLNLSAALDDPGSVTDDARPFVEPFLDTVRTLIVPLPREPVGVGARWEVSQVMGMMGLRISHTATYELLGMEDGALRIRVAAAETATAQTLPAQGMGDSAVLELRSLYGHGEGAATVDLARLLPRSMELEIRMDASAALISGEMRQPISLGGVMTSRIEAR